MTFLATALCSYAQYSRERLDQITDSLMAEGKALYRSEWASWYGTDAFMAKCPERQSFSGGYFSYETDQNFVNIFFSKDQSPKVIAAITFEKDFNSKNYTIDTATRNFTEIEQRYFDMRKSANDYMKTDTIFKGYKNTTLNLVPIIEKDQKKLYVLTGTSLHGVVIFGNDYLFNFGKNNVVISAEQLHKSIIPTYYQADNGKLQNAGIHSHVLPNQEFITATDICTLMLYEHLTTWETYNVVSKNYFSIWDCKKNTLLIMTMEAIRKIEADQARRHPKQE